MKSEPQWGFVLFFSISIFYLMFPNVKKSQDSYTNYLKRDHAKQFEVYTTITPPSVLLLYTTV